MLGEKAIRINLPLFSTVVPAIIFVFLGHILFVLAGTTVENKGKLILTGIFPSVQKHDIVLVLKAIRLRI